MKKGIIVFILFINVLFAAFSQNSNPIDLILILDTSQEMSSSYEKVNDYITGAFLKEFLRIGDTFHLICFSSKQRVDVARRIQDRGDVETIIGRMLLQYPVENGKDYQGVLNFAQDYASSLPQRAKKIVIVSSGGSQLDNAVNAVKQNFTSRNITVDVVQVNQGQALANPNSNRTASTRQPSENKTEEQTQTVQSGGKTEVSAAADKTASNAADSADSGTKSGSASAAAPDSKGGSGSDTAAAAKDSSGSTVLPDSKGGSGSDTAAAAKDSSGSAVLPDSKGSSGADAAAAAKDSSGSQNQETAKDKQVSDKNAVKSYGIETSTMSVPLLAGLAVLALIVLILIIIFVVRRMRSSPSRAIAGAALYSRKEKEEEVKFEDHSKELAKYAAAQSSRRTTPYQDKPVRKTDDLKTEINHTGPILLNLFVEDQSTAIGKRNIHSLKSGYSLTVGGGKSDFYIFLVPLPANIGELRRDGSKLTFIPKKPKYFPDIGSNELKDCLNKTIRIISDRNYEIRFRFEMWEDPLIALNKLMTSFKIPG